MMISIYQLSRFVLQCIAAGSMLIAGATLAQTRVEAQKEEQLLQQLCRAAADVHSLQGRFVQTKSSKLLKEKVRSEGRMVYRQPAELRWEYIKPNDFTFVVKNDQVSVSNKGKARKLSKQQAKIFKQMTQMMLGTITGELLKDARNFTTSFYEKDGNFSVYLEPKAKDMKKLFVRFVLELAPTLNMATAVEMHEKSGDTTRIEFDDVQLNQAIDEKEFALE